MTTFQLIKALFPNLDDPILAKCYEQLKRKQLKLSKGFLKDKYELFTLYTVRLRIAKEFRRSQFEEEAIIYWEEALRKLEACQEKEVFVKSALHEHDLYVLCFTADQKVLVSCIWYTTPVH